MKLKFKRTCSVKGATIEAGTSMDVDDHIAHDLIVMGRAEKDSGSSHDKKHHKGKK